MVDEPLYKAHVATEPSHQNVWAELKQHTKARIALGRAGASLPTRAWLDFQAAHAQAKDAVWAALDRDALIHALQVRHIPVIEVHSQNIHKTDYLQRPDLGRQLSDTSRTKLRDWKQQAQHQTIDVVIVLADGLSATAVQHHAIPMLDKLTEVFKMQQWNLAPVIIAQGARVALGDEVAEILGARMLVVMIGERPGLSSPDSMGIYYTWRPRVGTQDAARNCISNIHGSGCSVDEASRTLIGLMHASEQYQQSGIALKDQTHPTTGMDVKTVE